MYTKLFQREIIHYLLNIGTKYYEIFELAPILGNITYTCPNK